MVCFVGAGPGAPDLITVRGQKLVSLADVVIYAGSLVNPEILEESGEQRGPEGCLSVPGKWGLVTRPNRVRIKAQDRYGNWFEAEGEGLMARCFCHEIEHLNGHLYVEHIDHFLTEEEVEAFYEEEEARRGEQ